MKRCFEISFVVNPDEICEDLFTLDITFSCWYRLLLLDDLRTRYCLITVFSRGLWRFVFLLMMCYSFREESECLYIIVSFSCSCLIFPRSALLLCFILLCVLYIRFSITKKTSKAMKLRFRQIFHVVSNMFLDVKKATNRI
jgi:hypothetical protein